MTEENRTPPMDHKIKRPNGRWIPAAETDIRKLFDRVRRQQAAANAPARRVLHQVEKWEAA